MNRYAHILNFESFTNQHLVMNVSFWNQRLILKIFQKVRITPLNFSIYPLGLWQHFLKQFTNRFVHLTLFDLIWHLSKANIGKLIVKSLKRKEKKTTENFLATSRNTEWGFAIKEKKPKRNVHYSFAFGVIQSKIVGADSYLIMVFFYLSFFILSFSLFFLIQHLMRWERHHLSVTNFVRLVSFFASCFLCFSAQDANRVFGK